MSDELGEYIEAVLKGSAIRGVNPLVGDCKGSRSYQPRSHDLDAMPHPFGVLVSYADASIDNCMPKDIDDLKKEEILVKINDFLSYYCADEFRNETVIFNYDDLGSIYESVGKMKENGLVYSERLSSMVKLSRQSYNKIRKAIKDEPTMAIIGLGGYSSKKRKECFDLLRDISVFCREYSFSVEDEIKLIKCVNDMHLFHHIANITRARAQRMARRYDLTKPYYSLPDLPQD